MLDNLGMTNIWNDQNNSEPVFEEIKQRIVDIYHQSWHSNINNSNKLITYCKFKTTIRLETYLEYIREKKYRIALTKFRTSSQTGRYTNTPRIERLCINCHTNTIETEYHFLMICPKYNDIRQKYIS